MIEQRQIYIDGRWVDSAGTERLTVINPVTEAAVAEVPRGTAEDADRAIEAAAAALDDWARSPIEQRIAVITSIKTQIEQRLDELTQMIVSEVGQPLAEAYQRQTRSTVRDLELMPDAVRAIEWEEPFGDAAVRRQPAGVVSAITPWNAPLRISTLKAVAAIAAGCTVVLKASELAPLSLFELAAFADKAGLPAGVFNLVSGTGPEVGERLASHPLVDMVSLTGSVRAGARVMELGAPTIKRMSLELGGKSANLILEDADFEAAIADGVVDAFRNCGQVCGALSRMLVPRARLAEAEELAVRKAESYVLGDPFDPQTTLGPVKTARQRDHVRASIQVGIDEGARVLTGGPQAPQGLERGYYVRPTLFTGDNAMRIAREEVFGPVVVLIPYDGDEDAIAIANDSSYGLAGGVWAGDLDRAKAIARRIRTGRVRLNGAPLDPRLPHGGLKQSGVGREWGRFGIEEFLEYQALVA